MVDDNGVARLTTPGHSSIVTVPGASIVGNVRSGGDGDNNRYLAPEIQWRDDGGTDEILITEESDVYGMGMVVYEASHRLVSSGQELILTFISRS